MARNDLDRLYALRGVQTYPAAERLAMSVQQQTVTDAQSGVRTATANALAQSEADEPTTVPVSE